MATPAGLFTKARIIGKGRTDERDARRCGPGEEESLAARGRQPGPPPLARQRTGGGRGRNAVSPGPGRWQCSPSRTPGNRDHGEPGRMAFRARHPGAGYKLAPVGAWESAGDAPLGVLGASPGIKTATDL
jgi:hypothetical protein